MAAKSRHQQAIEARLEGLKEEEASLKADLARISGEIILLTEVKNQAEALALLKENDATTD
jgi:hypothetical protein